MIAVNQDTHNCHLLGKILLLMSVLIDHSD